MTDWVLIPCLKQLVTEFNILAPMRSRLRDGSIGDAAHQKRLSDHNADETGNVPTRDKDKINEVHAIDVDADFHVPGLSMERIVQYLLSECRKPGTSGKDRGRLKYIIYKKRIWEASNNWRERTYTGSNPHDKYAHFSAEYDTEFEYDTRPWGLVEKFGDDLPMDQTRFNQLLETALYQISIPDYALKNLNGQERKLALAAWLGWADGRADVARVEKKVDALTQRINSIQDSMTDQTEILKKIDTKLSTSQTRGAVNL